MKYIHAAMRKAHAALEEAVFSDCGGIEARREALKRTSDALSEYLVQQTQAYERMLDSPRFSKCPSMEQGRMLPTQGGRASDSKNKPPVAATRRQPWGCRRTTSAEDIYPQARSSSRFADAADKGGRAKARLALQAQERSDKTQGVAKTHSKSVD